MSVQSIAADLPPASLLEAPNPNRVPTKLLDQDDFLKLLVAQLANQDPLKPQTDQEFIAQMTQFTTLEQTKAMQADMAQLRALSVMGREVVIQTDDQTLITGVVTGYQMDGKNLKVIVGDNKYDLKDVVTIRVPTPTPQN